MKKVLLLLTLTSISFVWAQGEPGYDEYLEAEYSSHNDASSSDSVIDEIISTEPIIIGSIIGSETEEVQQDNNQEMDMTASIEAKFLKTAKSLNIPLWYRWKEFSFNAAIPYIYEKKKATGFTSDMQEAIYTKTSGLGDISIGASYGRYMEEWNTYLDGNISVKLPTGDEENTEKDDDGIEQTIPLGSGTTDISLGVSGFYFMNEFTFKGNLLYKLNGSKTFKNNYVDPVTYVSEDEDGNIGDIFIFSAGADYRLPYRFTAGANIIYGMKFADDFDKSGDAKNGLSFMDILPVVKYSISLFEFVAGAKIPVITELETYGDTSMTSKDIQETRSFAFFFRTNYRIF